MSAPPKKVAFIARFGPETYMRDLLDRGVVWMNSVGHFASLVGDAQRGDPDEALVRRYSPATARAVAEIHGVPGPKIPLPLAGPMRVWRRSDRRRAIYSLYGVDRLRDRIDPRCRELGDWVVFFANGREFVSRALAAATAAGHELALKRVTYVPESHSGEMDIFTKPEGFRHQNEWRLASRDPVPGGKLVLTLGPLHDLATLFHFDELRARV